MATETKNARSGAGASAASENQNSTYTRDENVSFMTVSEFKEKVGATTISVLKNPQTGKLFMSTNTGQNFKVQADIDQTKDIRVLVPDGDLDQACLVNTEGGAEQLFSL